MRKQNILLVEDDYLDVIQIKRVLNKMEVSNPLIVAHSGDEALKILREASSNHNKELPAVILLDINMPRMNGIEFLTELRKNYIFKNLKVFVMTTSDIDKSAAEELGVDGYIIKPFNYDNMDSKIDNFSLFLELMKLRNNN